MKRIILLLMSIVLTLTLSAQRPGNTSRSSGTMNRTSTSVSRPSTSSQSASRPSSYSTNRPSSYSTSRPTTSTTSRPTYTQSRPTTTSTTATRSNTNYRPTPSSTTNQYRTPSNQSRNNYSSQTVNRPATDNTRVASTRTVYQNSPNTGRLNDKGGNHPEYGHHGQNGPHSGPQPGHNDGHHHPVPHGMHPQPPCYHPIHHHHVHMHYHYCPVEAWIVHDYYWHGYWHYVHNYCYNDVVTYVRYNQSNTELIALASDDCYIYSLYHNNWENKTYLTISDENDRVLVKTQVNSRYCKLMTGDGGVWMFKNRDLDPMYITYIDGRLYMYEQD